jgi:hypothetical protein
MRWEQGALDEMLGRLRQLGLEKCAICGSTTLTAGIRPIVVDVGGVHDGKTEDSGTNILFWLAIGCDVCGYRMLFDSENLMPESTAMIEAEPPRL